MRLSVATALKGMYSQALVVAAVFVVLLTAAAHEECLARWDCPCAGGTKRVQRFHKRNHILVRTAHNTRRMTEQLLRKMVEDRFHNNTEHTQSLQRCAHVRDPVCLSVYLHQCDLDALPALTERLTPRTPQLQTLSEAQVLHEARHLLSSLAFFMAQARRDELIRHSTSGNGYIKDILVLENKGIYHLLCNLQRVFLSRDDLTWEPTNHKDTISRCLFQEFAPSDNRNFIVLYTLENALNNIAHRLTQLQQLGR